jgi:quercetin dioxygenase-like cupin family protein
MKIRPYTEIEATYFHGGEAEKVAARVVIGKQDGAPNFCMRVFEIGPGGHTPKHAHPWEHEMFVHAGEVEIFGNGRWTRAKSGSTVFIPAQEEHQLRNPGPEPLVVVCLVPAAAPEL